MTVARRGRPATIAALLALLASSLAGVSPARAAPVALVNPGFESGRPGLPGNPEGWFSIQHAGDLSYTFRLDGNVRHQGTQSLRIDNVGPEPFGSVFQQLQAASLRGRRVRFAAWLRTQDARGSVTGRGAVLMVQAMQNGTPVAFNHMADAAVAGTTDWQRYAIELTVPANAEQVEVGAMLHGPGSLWLDDAELEVLAADPGVDPAQRSSSGASSVSVHKGTRQIQ